MSVALIRHRGDVRGRVAVRIRDSELEHVSHVALRKLHCWRRGIRAQDSCRRAAGNYGPDTTRSRHTSKACHRRWSSESRPIEPIVRSQRRSSALQPPWSKPSFLISSRAPFAAYALANNILYLHLSETLYEPPIRPLRRRAGPRRPQPALFSS